MFLNRNLMLVHRVKRNLQGLENWSDEQDIIKEFNKMKIKANFNYEPFKNLRITNTGKTGIFHVEDQHSTL